MLVFAILMAILGLGCPAYLFAQPAALAHWRGGWRKAALAPLLLTVPAVLYGVVGVVQNSNLWPLPVMFVFGLGSLYLAALWIAKEWF